MEGRGGSSPGKRAVPDAKANHPLLMWSQQDQGGDEGGRSSCASGKVVCSGSWTSHPLQGADRIPVSRPSSPPLVSSRARRGARNWSLPRLPSSLSSWSCSMPCLPSLPPSSAATHRRLSSAKQRSRPPLEASQGAGCWQEPHSSGHWLRLKPNRNRLRSCGEDGACLGRGGWG